MKKKWISSRATLLCATIAMLQASSVSAKELWITTGHDVQQKLFSNQKSLLSSEDATLLKIDESELPRLSAVIHEEFHRCGGFMAFDSFEEAQESLNNVQFFKMAKVANFADYQINQQDLIAPLLNEIDAINISTTINKLSSFNNRFYKSPTGVESQAWLKSTWESLAQGRSDVKVEYFQHKSWNQPSVILTIQGAHGDGGETIVLGGHADSISGYFGSATSRAPGADDNASGIATLTEVIRILMKSSYVPDKTIKFMAYAAEEVGLLGSKEIANSFRAQKSEVIGVLQLDMTNFKGSDLDIVMMADYTNEAQNQFIAKLIDTYVKVPWGMDRCGYACSDHASWYQAGYPSSIPFEARMKEMNHQIHTANDTIARSGDNANHAAKFAKLALSYLIELDR